MSVQEWIGQAQAAALRINNPGVSSLDELRNRSGLEFLQDIAAGVLPLPPIGKTLNFFLLEADQGRVVFQGTPTFDFYNPIGTVHGGWAATLLDSCMACAVQTTLKKGQSYTTAELKLNLVRPLTDQTGPVRAEGKVIHAGRQIATSEGRLVGPDGRLYAHGTTTCMIFDLPKEQVKSQR
ncbi:MAG TPA: PaaI family thioesterase [Burkholderiales bacterium]|nr:PaaI family thioesterase [Burkholderiales bacterium]